MVVKFVRDCISDEGGLDRGVLLCGGFLFLYLISINWGRKFEFMRFLLSDVKKGLGVVLLRIVNVGDCMFVVFFLVFEWIVECNIWFVFDLWNIFFNFCSNDKFVLFVCGFVRCFIVLLNLFKIDMKYGCFWNCLFSVCFDVNCDGFKNVLVVGIVFWMFVNNWFIVDCIDFLFVFVFVRRRMYRFKFDFDMLYCLFIMFVIVMIVVVNVILGIGWIVVVYV